MPDTETHIQKSFEDIGTPEEFYQWTSSVLVGQLYTSATGFSDADVGSIYGVNNIVGAVRIGQVRAKPHPCRGQTATIKFAPNSTASPTCYPVSREDFEQKDEDKSDFGANGVTWSWAGNFSAGSPGRLHWSIQEERDLGMLGRSGASGFTTFEEVWFPSPAFPVILPNPASPNAEAIATRRIAELQQGGYITAATRLIAVQLTLANPDLDVIMPFVMYIELPGSGGLNTGFKYNVVRLYSITSSTSDSNAVIEMLVLVFYLYFFFKICTGIARKGLGSLLKARNLINAVSILFYAGMWWARYSAEVTSPAKDEVFLHTDTFYAFEAAASYRSLSVLLSAINSFLVVFTLADYLSGFGGLQLVTGSLYKSLLPSVSFFVVFIVVFVGFAIAHMMIWGQEMEQFRNLSQTSYTLMMSLLGDVPVEEMRRVNPSMTPILVIGYICTLTFIVLNIFIAIVTEAYERQKTEMEEGIQANLLADLSAYLVGKCRALLGESAEATLRWLMSGCTGVGRSLTSGNPQSLKRRMAAVGIEISDRAADRAFFTVEGSEYAETKAFTSMGLCAGQVGQLQKATAAIKAPFEAMRQEARRRAASFARSNPIVMAKAGSPSAATTSTESLPPAPSNCSSAMRTLSASEQPSQACCSARRSCCQQFCEDPTGSSWACLKLAMVRLTLVLTNSLYIHVYKVSADNLRKHAQDSPDGNRLKEALFKCLRQERDASKAMARILQARAEQVLSGSGPRAQQEQAKLAAALTALGEQTPQSHRLAAALQGAAEGAATLLAERSTEDIQKALSLLKLGGAISLDSSQGPLPE